ncbi:MAG: LysM peptidoglycan-binding domain-containing protein [Pontibacter sp.]|nr:LysM peptidoglycan-binding domain-containing protein [Pontibacter sp.]
MKSIITCTLTNLFLLFALITAKAAPAAEWPLDINPHAVAAPGDSVYVVQKGDTYYSLSRRFNIPLDSLQKWNANKLQIGQTLYLSRQGQASITTPKSKPQPAGKAAKTAAATTRPTGSTSAAIAAAPSTAAHKTKSRVLVIPFDPYLYFSDADEEIAQKSNIPRQNVRHVFRNRLNAMLAPEGYETIHLLGGVYRDSVSELSRLYKSLSYGYQDNKQSKYNRQPVEKEESGGALDWVQRQKEKLGLEKEEQPLPVSQDPTKHFGVTVKDPEFYSYFNKQYGIDYYVFINQFEVKTVYENCLDRAALNYERDFLVHYSIYNNKGELVSGNKVKIEYMSNMNDVQRIVSDNMPTMAKRVLSDLPPSGK